MTGKTLEFDEFYGMCRLVSSLPADLAVSLLLRMTEGYDEIVCRDAECDQAREVFGWLELLKEYKTFRMNGKDKG